jgi:hypothetical protein
MLSGILRSSEKSHANRVTPIAPGAGAGGFPVPPRRG